MPWQALAIEGGLIVLDLIYHRWIDPPPKPVPAGEVQIPIVTQGASIPLVYGRGRIKSPVLAWTSSPNAFYWNPSLSNSQDAEAGTLTGMIAPPTFVYTIDMMFVLGMPFFGGTNKIYAIYSGDLQLITHDAVGKTLDSLVGNGGFINTQVHYSTIRIDKGPSARFTDGWIEFMNGGSAQSLVDPTTFDRTTTTGTRMYFDGVDLTTMTGYRGLMLAGLTGGGGGQLGGKWIIGTEPTIPAYSFEVSSYPGAPLATQPGVECNPVDVLYDLLIGGYGKLGLATSLIDTVSFAAAGAVLATEGNGYSRVIESSTSVYDLIQEIMAQIDGVFFEDPSDGKLHIRLVRQDYDPNACPEINPINCEQLQNVAIGGWDGIPNRIRVIYTDRSNDYKDGSVLSLNQANAVGHNGEVIEKVVTFPAVCTPTLASTLAAREILAQSRPITRLTAIVNRSFYATNPGDVVAISWPDYGWSGMLFRVARVSRGTLADGRIKLDLIQEYFNVSRGVHETGGIVAFPPVKKGGLPL